MNEQGQPPGAGFEIAVVGAGAAVCAAGFVAWLGARLGSLFTGGEVHGGLGEWLLGKTVPGMEKTCRTALIFLLKLCYR